MRYLLDTNACIALLNGTSQSMQTHVRRRKPSAIGLPAPVAYELYYGAYKSRRASRNLELLDRVGLEIVPFDASDARAAGAVRSELESMGQPIGPYDTLIAGQARARGLVLVTANSREFRRVPGLVCEDWAAEN
ncbi:MAG: type II toxin-antitoxin system VapC family toxin [Gammaproteobacteria bacterium]|nr:type II toxin-antitoxin system VapC family toxin [Gammaproteobacteria bacterium]MYH86214.1 type II toxin-antitoxin system VapC family toxin [Gammaproteobacteria bacterium]MYK05908.1 type II toxin-antitoxin system VapC family toxin [Gammaproteobacteria bacterium]